MFGLGGRKFIKDVQADGTRPLFAWTVNSVGWMRWAIGKRLDAVITDDPKLYLEVCERYRKEMEKKEEVVVEEEGEEQADGGQVKVEDDGGGLLARAKGLLFTLALPILVRYAIWRLGYYRRVGTPEEAREILRKL